MPTQLLTTKLSPRSASSTITTPKSSQFFLNPINAKTTRLIIRSRLTYEPSLGNTLMWRVFTDPISFVMERSMLQGIKVRAEAT
jgi:hypothetical protein